MTAKIHNDRTMSLTQLNGIHVFMCSISNKRCARAVTGKHVCCGKLTFRKLTNLLLDFAKCEKIIAHLTESECVSDTICPACVVICIYLTSVLVFLRLKCIYRLQRIQGHMVRNCTNVYLCSCQYTFSG